MIGWWIAMGIGAACLALTYNHHRQRRAERARIDLIRTQVDAWLSALQPPTGEVGDGDRSPVGPQHPAGFLPIPAGPQQPGVSPEPPDRGGARCRRRVVLGDMSSLSTTLPPLREAS